MSEISIVIPCFNEEGNIDLLYHALVAQLSNSDTLGNYELIFVDDCSKDDTLSKIKKIASHSSKVKYLAFSDNHGKETALLAGIQKSRGRYCVVMDADLQDPPTLIPKMYALMVDSGYDCVVARRTSRKGEHILHRISASIFYPTFKLLTGLPIQNGERDFRIMDAQVREKVLSCARRECFLKGIFYDLKLNMTYVDYENINRSNGLSSWSTGELIKYYYSMLRLYLPARNRETGERFSLPEIKETNIS